MDDVSVRKICSAILLGLLLMADDRVVATEEVEVQINQNKLEFPDAQAYIDPATNQIIPIRLVSEALGAQVQWESAKWTVQSLTVAGKFR